MSKEDTTSGLSDGAAGPVDARTAPSTWRGDVLRAHDDRTRPKTAPVAETAFPPFIERLASDLAGTRAMPPMRAVRVVTSTTRRWASGDGRVKPSTMRWASEALRDWDDLKRQAEVSVEKWRLPNGASGLPVLPMETAAYTEVLKWMARRAVRWLSSHDDTDLDGPSTRIPGRLLVGASSRTA